MAEIQLTKGKIAIVDDEDFEWLNQWKWCYSKGYALRGIGPRGKTHTIIMHRLIMQTPPGLFVDHINRNGLDNRRSNLRNCTQAENNRNRPTNSISASGYKGVRVDKTVTSRPYAAYITVDGQHIYLGHFVRAEEAALVYNIAALKYHGEFAWLNPVELDKQQELEYAA